MSNRLHCNKVVCLIVIALLNISGDCMLCSSWEKLEDAIQQIFNENAGDLSFEELYRTGYNMVLHKHGDVLYNNVERVLKDRSCLLCDKVEKNTDET